MSKIKLLGTLMLFISLLRAQNGLDTLQMIYDSLDVANIPSGILWDRTPYVGSFHPNPDWYNGSLTARPGTKNNYYDLLGLFNLAAYDDSIAPPPPTFYSSEETELNLPYDVPLAVMHYDYQKIDSLAILNERIGFDTTTQKYYDLPGENPYNNKKLFMGASMIRVAHVQRYVPIIKTGQPGQVTVYYISYKLPRSLYFSNINEEPIKIEVDYANGNGFVNAAFDRVNSITYGTGSYCDENPYSTKELRIRMHYGEVGSFYQAKIRLKIGCSDKPDSVLNSLENLPLSNTSCVVEPESGFYRTEATAYLLYGQDSLYPDRLDKPMIFIEGFDSGTDPYGNQSWTGFSTGYFATDIIDDLFPQLRLLPKLTDTLNQLGYDVLIVDFKNGRHDMRNNGATVIRLIQWLNEQLALLGVDEQIVVTGASMGGIIARYALLRLEDEGCCHNTRLYATLDSPHNGANIPLGIQLFLRNLGYKLVSENVRRRYEGVMRSPASMQLLSLHVNSTHNISKSFFWWRAINPWASHMPNTAEGMHRSFYNKLQAMGGHPANCLRLSIVNGSITAKPGNLNNGDLILDVALDIDAPLEYPASMRSWMIIGGKVYALNSYGTHHLTRSKGLLAGSLSLTLFTIDWATYFAGWVARIFIASLSDPLFEAMMRGFFFINNSLDRHTSQGRAYPLYDQAPGSSTNTMFLMEKEINNVASSFARAPKHSHTFITSLSALDIDTNNLNVHIEGLDPVKNGLTPFDDFYGNIDGEKSYNQRHVEITKEIIKWLAQKLENNRYPLNTSDTSVLYKNLQTTFNYGKNEYRKTAIKFIQQLDVDNRGRLFINNQNYPLHYGPGVFPIRNIPSKFTVYTNASDCRGSWLKIKAGGQVELGDRAVNHNRGELVIRPSTFLEIFNGGKLVVNDNSRVLIQEGAELIVHPGAIIELSGENAILELQGKLTLKENAELAPAGNGFVRFNQEMTNGTAPNFLNYEGNNRMKFIGANKNDKRIEIAQNTFLLLSLDSLIIKNAQVELEDEVSLSVYGSIYARHASFTSSTGSRYEHRGLRVFGQPHVVIQNCDFTEGYQGLTVYPSNQGNPLNISYCNFSNNEYGFRSYGKKFVLAHCNFSQNKKSVTAQNIDGTCLMKSCNITENTQYAVHISGQSGGELKVINCLLRGGPIGLEASELSIISVCSKYHDVDIGIKLTEGNLEMGNMARNTFDNNEYSILLQHACRVNLRKGHNTFSNNRSYYLYGTINSNCKSNYHYNSSFHRYELDVKDNSLPLRDGVVPINLVMNNLNAQQASLFGLHNWAPWGSSWYSCLIETIVPTFAECEGCSVVIPIDPEDEPLVDVLNEAIANISWSDTGEFRRDDMRAITMLQELIRHVNENYSYREEQEEGELMGGSDRLMMDLAFDYYLTALSNAYRFGFLELNRAEEDGDVSEELQFILREADLRIEHETQAPSVENAYLLRFHFELAKAQAYRIGEHYQEALEILNTFEGWVEYPETEVVSYWRCVCETERDYILERMGEEEFAQRMESCMQAASNKRGTPPLPYYKGVPLADVIGASETEGIQAELMPNPTDGSGTIHLIGQHGMIHYQLSSPVGEVLQEGEIEEEEFYKTLKLPYASGVYYLSLKDAKSDKLKQFKWVIVR